MRSDLLYEFLIAFPKITIFLVQCDVGLWFGALIFHYSLTSVKYISCKPRSVIPGWFVTASRSWRGSYILGFRAKSYWRLTWKFKTILKFYFWKRIPKVCSSTPERSLFSVSVAALKRFIPYLSHSLGWRMRWWAGLRISWGVFGNSFNLQIKRTFETSHFFVKIWWIMELFDCYWSLIILIFKAQYVFVFAVCSRRDGYHTRRRRAQNIDLDKL